MNKRSSSFKGKKNQPPLKKQNNTSASLYKPTRWEVIQKYSKWARPPVKPLDVNQESLIFQVLDVEYYVDAPIQGMPGLTNGTVPVVRIYGVNEVGNSVTADIHSYYPYIYIPCPPFVTYNNLDTHRKILNEHIAFATSSSSKIPTGQQLIIQIEIEKRRSIMGYSDQDSDFLKISCRIPAVVPPLRTFIENEGFPGEGKIRFKAITYESDVLFNLRFMIDKSIVGNGWIELPAGKYSLVSGAQRDLSTQIVADVYHDHVVALDHRLPKWGKIAPLRILSFDIECAGRRGIFPEPSEDKVIQISNYVKIHGEKGFHFDGIFNLKGCSPLPGHQLFCFDDEKDLLNEWSEFFRQVDPDIIIGYNSSGFDFPYLYNRARTIGATGVHYMSRIPTRESKLIPSVFSSKAYGTRETLRFSLPGRVQTDVLHAIQRDHKLRSYKLDNTAFLFLKERKADIDHKMITPLHNGTDSDRARLALYCLKDSLLTFQIFQKLMLLTNYVEMARATGVPYSFLLEKGQSIKTVSQLYRQARSESMLIPYYQVDREDDESYTGAHVFDPIVGFYEEPVITEDFTSMYPTIMAENNLSYDTLLTREQAKNFKPEDYTVTPCGDIFVKAHIKKGIMATIVQNLLGERQKAKDLLKVETDDSMRAVYDGRQLAFKVSANSVYGFTGAKIGKLPCIPIAAGVTSFGRMYIEKSAEIAMQEFPELIVKVIYGDTDSIMIFTRCKSAAEAIALGKKLAVIITAKLRAFFGVNMSVLAFEKIYYPFLLLGKKRYIGQMWVNEKAPFKIDAKGVESVRRDNAPLTAELIKAVSDKIMMEKDIEGSKKLVRDKVRELYEGKIDLSKLVISKGFTKPAEEYKNKQAHIVLMEKMKARGGVVQYNMGDRIPYVMVKSHKGALARDKTEDPIYVLENGIPIDVDYYINNQLKLPITRLFGPLMDNPASLFQGDHTLKRVNNVSENIGIAKFCVRKESCLGCGVEMGREKKALCDDCSNIPGRAQSIHLATLKEANAAEKKNSEYWTQCQTCQGTLLKDIICSSSDCPIFYARQSSKLSVKKLTSKLDRFSLEW